MRNWKLLPSIKENFEQVNTRFCLGGMGEYHIPQTYTPGLMTIRPDQTTRDKIDEIECYLSYLPRLYLLLSSFLFSPFFTFFTGQRHLQSNIFEINFSSRKSQSAFFSFGVYIKVVKLVASHFFVSFSCSLGPPSVDQSDSKYLVATAEESNLGKTWACWLKPKESKTHQPPKDWRDSLCTLLSSIANDVFLEK